MTKKALVSTAELKRLANVAKSQEVTIEIEVDGTIIRIKPYEADDERPKPERYEDFDL